MKPAFIFLFLICGADGGLCEEGLVAHRTCNKPVQANARGLKSSYCPEHFAFIYAAPPAKSANNPPPATWLKNRDMVWARG
jgi:hypothetical protein